jgi:hypothetical protein
MLLRLIDRARRDKLTACGFPTTWDPGVRGFG